MNTMTETVDEQVMYLAGQGYSVVANTPHGIVMRKSKRVNHAAHLIASLFTLGLWLWVWLVIAIVARDKTVTVTPHTTAMQTDLDAGKRKIWVMCTIGLIVFVLLISLA